MFKKLLEKWACWRGRHAWELTLDEPGEGGNIARWFLHPDQVKPKPLFIKGLLSRRLVYSCSKCPMTKAVNKWAFAHASGALMAPGERMRPDQRPWRCR